MELYHLQDAIDVTKYRKPSIVLAVGFFDGVHKGHQEVIKRAQALAKETDSLCGVMTFDPHPSVILRKGRQQVRYITPLEDKEALLEELGIDALYVVQFTKELASMSPEDFVEHFFVELGVTGVVAGFDFTYGHKGKGNMQTLTDQAHGRFSVMTTGKVTEGTEKVSSTRIRGLLEDGHVEAAHTLLSRPFMVKADVTDIRGSEIKLRIREPYYPLAEGIYEVRIKSNGESVSGTVRLNSVREGVFTSENHTFLKTHDEISIFYIKMLSQID